MYENKIIVDGRGSTDNGIKIVKKFDLSSVEKVSLVKQGTTEGGPADVTFHFADGDEITIRESFGIGYGGTGPWGIHDILVQMGVPKEAADRLFTYHLSAPLEFDIPYKIK